MKSDLLYMNTTSLAFLGDAIYEAYVREYLIKTIKAGADKLHRAAVKYVRADAQAGALKLMLGQLSEEELGLVKRARNKRNCSKPKNADPVIYKWATAFEALVGYLYLSEQKDRMEEIVHMAMESVEKGDGKKTNKK